MKASVTHKLDALRAALAHAGVQAFILPVGDEFLGEYVPAASARLAWLTGFTGSAGTVCVLAGTAALFTDGRYTLQARQEAPEAVFAHFNSGATRPEEWLTEQMKEGQALGFDPWLHSQREVERWEKALKPKGITLVPLSPNPLDALWEDRPEPPASEPFVHALEYAGETHEEKRLRAGDQVKKSGADVAVLAATDSVNWLLNLRASDVPFSPLLLAYALLRENGRVSLYVDSSRISPTVCAHLVPGVEIRPPIRLDDDLFELGLQHARVLVDPVLTPAWFVSQLTRSGATPVFADDPVQKLKAVKNATELAGIRHAHRRDGLALVRFFHWLERETARHDVTERGAAAKLLEFRKLAPEFVSPSFETIPGSGPNGAIVHYRATQSSNRVLHQNDLFLLDSGGQYPDGTTDVTRTLAIGEPSPEHRERFTRVLKGHIALARAHFPHGTSGGQLDVLARQSLWEAGLDYDHGTGHGVGHFLSVHEGPQRIGKRGGDVVLEPGMILSNEPGYYREGQYGIRIENLVAVREAGRMENGKPMLGFETLTLAPIDLRLVDAGLLTEDEKNWLNAYHAAVRDAHAAELEEDEKLWLAQATQALP